MADKLTFLGLAEKVLREEKRPLSPAEIWKIAEIRGYPPMLESKGLTPAHTLYASLLENARDHPKTKFYKLGERPARYFLKDLQNTIKGNQIAKAVEAPDASVEGLFVYNEKDLHPFLAYFARVFFRAHTKTIRHNTSSKKEFGEWVHPDMVGVYYPVKDWSKAVLELSAATGNTALKVYSFELKKSVSFQNLREAFFQAVSNSSWANEGFLAAAEISEDDDFRTELRRLSASFGIGVIELSLENPNSSKVLYPAREREVIDWDTLNKMTMNKDVQELLTRIKNDLQTQEVIEEKYDSILDSLALVASIKKAKQ